MIITHTVGVRPSTSHPFKAATAHARLPPDQPQPTGRRVVSTVTYDSARHCAIHKEQTFVSSKELFDQSFFGLHRLRALGAPSIEIRRNASQSIPETVDSPLKDLRMTPDTRDWAAGRQAFCLALTKHHEVYVLRVKTALHKHVTHQTSSGVHSCTVHPCLCRGVGWSH